MPKKGQTRDHLKGDLRAIVADNVTKIMGGKSSQECAEGSGISYKAFERIKSGENSSLDTIEAVAKALGVMPYQLLMKGSLREIFDKPVSNERLGSGWTRPDRQPLLQSESRKNSSRGTKLKTRG